MVEWLPMEKLFLAWTLFSVSSCWGLSVTSTQSLRFNRGFPGDAAATLVATATTAGTITVLGTPNVVVNVTFPPSVTLSFSGSTLSVTTFTRSPATFRLSAAGTGTLSVGGQRSAIPAATPPGTYTGNASVTLTEQGTGNTTIAVLPIEAPVWRLLTLAKNRDLDFGLGVVGDGAKIVNPTAPTAASINILGQPSATFTITFPASITMNCGGCGGTAAQRQLTATLASNPTSPAALDGTGAAVVRIGGTRQAITVGKRQGTYTATFTVTFAYN